MVIAPGEAYADRLLHGSGPTLADDATYKRAFGPASDRTAFQFFLRVDKVRALVERFQPPSARGIYDAVIAPVLGMFESIGARGTVTAGEADFRLLLALAP